MIRSKSIGLPVLAALALLVGASSASATVLTSPAGTAYTGAVKAKSSKHVLIHMGAKTITCANSQLEWEVSSHGPASTVKGAVTAFTFEECSNETTVTVAQKGVFEVHTPSSELIKYFPITWTGFEIKINVHSIPFYCIYKGGPFEIGAITPSALTGQTAAIDIEASLPLISGACSQSLKLTAAYSVTTPDYLDAD